MRTQPRPLTLRGRLRAAVGATGAESSDFDLSPSVRLAPNRTLRSAAVLIAILDGPEGARVLLTKRSPRLKHHPGQVAFPGGKLDPGDATPVAAALREAQEEVALDPASVEVIGALAPHETVTGFSVTPVLALAPPFCPVAETGEVAEVFTVPFAHVASISAYSVERRRWRGEWRRYYAVPYGPYYIWGATARILRALAERLPE